MTGLKTNTKDLSKSFQKAKIISELWKVNPDTLMGAVITRELKNEANWDGLINDLQQHLSETPPDMITILGQKAFNLIANY